MSRWFLRALIGLAALALVAGLAYRLMRGPSASEILASIERQEAPVLSPAEALEAFAVAPGFRVELVAAEPLVVDPVAIDWDDEGRLYVVEMRGYMPDIDGRGEERPVGRVVVLEDEDGDGAMDSSRVFAEGLVMPRAIAVLPQGVLIGEPPNLWLCRDTTGDGRCDLKTRLTSYAVEGNPEHAENRLLPALDGWIYNSKSRRRFRFRTSAQGRAPGESIDFEVSATQFRGQWGIDQDDEGRLYYNHNSGWVYADAVPADVGLRHPAEAGRLARAGVNVDLGSGELAWGVRLAPGLNRAYVDGTLRSDGRQAGPTGVSGLVVQRGDQFGDEYVGDVFVPESAGGVVAQFRPSGEWLDDSGELSITAEHRLVPDPDWEKREFLASSDERFRPVDGRIGPDGALWVIDMYRGVIQHAEYVSDYLRRYVGEQGLEPPGATGRIWRVVRDDRPIEYRPPPLDGFGEQLQGLRHANGWVRDHAARRLVAEEGPYTVGALRRFEQYGAKGSLHALWGLEFLGGFDRATWMRATTQPVPARRKVALAAAGARFGETREGFERISAMRDGDEDAEVRLWALHAIAGIRSGTPNEEQVIEALGAALRSARPLEVEAALSGLTGREAAVLDAELARLGDRSPSAAEQSAIVELATALHFAAQNEAESGAGALLDRAHALEARPDLQALLMDGVVNAADRNGNKTVELAAAHPLFENPPAAALQAIERARIAYTWPGDPRPGGARALSDVEEARRERGAALYAASCANCHGGEGRGLAGLAPPLAESPWVRDADEWLVRIALHGVAGPIQVAGEEWNLAMPGHGSDPRFDDEGVASVLTFLRRAFGHGDEPVSPETVARIRAETGGRATPWSADELLALPVDHRLDRYVGLYRVPLVGIEMRVARAGSRLAVGRSEGGMAELEELSPGNFVSADIQLRFDAPEDGAINGATATYQGTTFPVSRSD